MVAVAENIDLTKLPPDQLRDLGNRISFLLNPSGSVDGPVTDKGRDVDQDLVIAELEAALKGKGYEKIPLTVLMRSTAGPHFRRGVKILMSFIKTHFSPKKRIQTVRLVRIVLRCICNDLARRNVPVTPKTVCQALEKAPAYVQKMFPDYLSAGMLPLVLKRFSA